MERELCLVLDEAGYYRLVLKKGLDHEIDEYTSKKFEGPEQIREVYKEEIEHFLELYKNRLEKSNNPSYKGRIVVVIPEKVGSDYRDYQRTVLYKKHIVAFNEIINNRKIMISFADYEKNKKEKLITDHFYYTIKKSWDRRNGVKKFIRDWLSYEKKRGIDYYKIIRDMLKVYEYERKSDTSLKTIDKIYEEYKQKQSYDLKKKMEKCGSIKLDKSSHTVLPESIKYEEDDHVVINGVKYDIDEVTMFDMEQIDESTSSILPDGKGLNGKRYQ